MGGRADACVQEMKEVCDGAKWPKPVNPNPTLAGREWSTAVRDITKEMYDAAAAHSASTMDNWSLLSNLKTGMQHLVDLMQGVDY